MVLLDKYFAVPSLLWFSSAFNNYIVKNIPGPAGELMQRFHVTDTMQYVFGMYGTILALLLFIGRPKFLMNWFNYLILWVLYLSHFAGGDRFMSFQWDLLLLEAGFLAIWFAPNWHTGIYHTSPTTSIVRELIRFLALRLMFGGGFVKLLSRCKTWWSFTALHYHLETQPIPHILSWYQHNLTTDLMKRYGVVLSFVVELALPWLFYSPFREHRVLASVSTMALMLGIALGGNYNFFNGLTCVVCCIVLDDELLLKWMPTWVFRALDIKLPLSSLVEQLRQ